MTSFKFGDVVLVKFPFTDQQNSKQRPAVVISGAAYGRLREDVVILAITSKIRLPLRYGEYLVTDWAAAGLVKASMFKPLITTVEKALILRTLGALGQRDSTSLQALLTTLLDPGQL